MRFNAVYNDIYICIFDLEKCFNYQHSSIKTYILIE